MLNHCVEVEEPDRTFERHEEKCAKRTAEALAQSAKLQALIEESRRRLALLDGLAEANDGVTAAYTDINLIAPAFSILGSSFVDPCAPEKKYVVCRFCGDDYRAPCDPGMRHVVDTLIGCLQVRPSPFKHDERASKSDKCCPTCEVTEFIFS